MNFLDSLLLFALLTFVLWWVARRWQRWRQMPKLAKELRARGVRSGPVPGYAWIPPKTLDTDRLRVLLSEDVPPWDLVTLEAFNSPDRTRTVLRVVFFEEPRVPWLAMLEMARGMQHLSSAEVVSVEWMEEKDPEARCLGTLLYSPDRRLWHGGETDALVLEDVSEGGPHLRAAVPGTSIIPGSGWYLPETTRTT